MMPRGGLGRSLCLVSLFVCEAGGLYACGFVGQPERPAQKIAGTDIELYQATVAGRACVVARFSTSVSVTCDWSN
jgi:hypothetical protein